MVPEISDRLLIPLVRRVVVASNRINTTLITADKNGKDAPTANQSAHLLFGMVPKIP